MASLRDLSGTYGVAIWNPRARKLVATRDALGLGSLYFRMMGSELWVSDSLKFAEDSEIDRGYVAAFIADGHLDLDRTIWKDVSSVPAGSALEWQEGRSAITQLWSPEQIAQETSGDLDENAQTYRSLAEKAIGQQLDPEGATWADLSGGLDSSTVVALACVIGQRDSKRRLGGTLTMFGSLGDEDETLFSDAVVKKYSVRNLKFGDAWPWRDDGRPAPLTEHPTRDYPFYARDREISEALVRHGARTLLSGNGPDNCLPHTGYHVGDLLLTGRWREGFNQLWESALADRRRIWDVFAKDVILPVMPIGLQSLARRRRVHLPEWLRPSFVTEFHYETHMLRRHLSFGRRGTTCQTLVAQRLKELSTAVQGWRNLDRITVRHPLLYQPLVEFCLRLPHSHRTNLKRSKPVLRGAMKDVLPSMVLNRRSKAGSVLRRFGWALATERELIRRLLDTSVLAELGCLEPASLNAAIDRTIEGRGTTAMLRPICLALSLETWLATRYGHYDRHLTSTRRSANESKAAHA